MSLQFFEHLDNKQWQRVEKLKKNKDRNSTDKGTKLFAPTMALQWQAYCFS